MQFESVAMNISNLNEHHTGDVGEAVDWHSMLANHSIC